MIQEGEALPQTAVMEMTEAGPSAVETAEIFSGKKVVLFAVPGAYTPTCHMNHMPGFVEHAAAIKAKGVDAIVCLSVNDPFVLGEWAKATGAAGVVRILSDWDAGFTKALGLEIDLGVAGLGVRSKRYAMIVDDGRVTKLMVEETPKTADASGAAAVLAAL